MATLFTVANYLSSMKKNRFCIPFKQMFFVFLLFGMSLLQAAPSTENMTDGATGYNSFYSYLGQTYPSNVFVMPSPHEISLENQYKAIRKSNASPDPRIVTVTIFARPVAKFDQNEITVCEGISTSLKVNLTGDQPFSITYHDGVKDTMVGNIYAYEYDIRILSPSSTVSYTLKEISDAHCSDTLSDQAKVIVKPNPTAVFVGGVSTCYQVNTSLMVSLTGAKPFTLTYYDGKKDTTVANIYSNTYIINVLNPTKTTTYQLISVSDSIHCGEVSLQSSATVTVMELPSASFSTHYTTSICSGDTGSFFINLTGVPPFSLTYHNGISTVSINNILEDQYKILIPYGPQSLTYTLISVSDDHCTNDLLQSDSTIIDKAYAQMNDLQIIGKWDDVLFISSRDSGHMRQFQSFQWYHWDLLPNGDSVLNPIKDYAQAQYYTTNVLEGTYAVEVIYADGTSVMSCPYHHTPMQNARFEIYPNPANTKVPFHVLLETENGEVAGAEIQVFDVLGKMLLKKKVSQNITEISALTVPGSYIIRVKMPDGRLLNKKIVISK